MRSVILVVAVDTTFYLLQNNKYNPDQIQFLKKEKKLENITHYNPANE